MGGGVDRRLAGTLALQGGTGIGERETLNLLGEGESVEARGVGDFGGCPNMCDARLSNVKLRPRLSPV